MSSSSASSHGVAYGNPRWAAAKQSLAAMNASVRLRAIQGSSRAWPGLEVFESPYNGEMICVQGWLVQAMAYQRLGQADKVRRYMDQITAAIAELQRKGARATPERVPPHVG